MDIIVAIFIVALAYYFTKSLIAVLIIAAAVAFVVYVLRNGSRRL